MFRIGTICIVLFLIGVATWEPYVTHDYDVGCGVDEITVVYASSDFGLSQVCDLVFMMVVRIGLWKIDGRNLYNT